MVNMTFCKVDITFWAIIALAAFATTVQAGCAGDRDGDLPALTPIEEWTAEPEYEIGDQLEGDALFGRIRDVRPAADGSRVYVLDSQSMEVTIWTPDGTRIGRVGGRGEGPGEFSDPGPLFLFDDRFQVGDHSRYTTFALEGEVLRTDGFPPGVGLLDRGMDMATARRSFTRFQVMAMFADGSVGALALPPWVLDGDVPEEEDPAVPVLRASQDGGAWGIDTLGLLSFRDVYATLEHPEFGEIDPVQPWIRPDHFQMDPWNSSVVISRSSRSQPGVLELIEISLAGDTIWTRQVQLPPIPVTEDDVDTAVDEQAPFLGADSSGPSPMLRRAIRGALIIPSHWPAANEIRLMSNGEIWFQPAGHEIPTMWYAVRMGEDDAPIRSVVLPERFRPMDVNATHVWGIRRDELDVEYVAGLRLEREGG